MTASSIVVLVFGTLVIALLVAGIVLLVVTRPRP